MSEIRWTLFRTSLLRIYRTIFPTFCAVIGSLLLEYTLEKRPRVTALSASFVQENSKRLLVLRLCDWVKNKGFPAPIRNQNYSNRLELVPCPQGALLLIHDFSYPPKVTARGSPRMLFTLQIFMFQFAFGEM